MQRSLNADGLLPRTANPERADPIRRGAAGPPVVDADSPDRHHHYRYWVLLRSVRYLPRRRAEYRADPAVSTQPARTAGGDWVRIHRDVRRRDAARPSGGHTRPPNGVPVEPRHLFRVYPRRRV